MIGLAKTLSTELAPFNVTVNNVCPGYTLTDRVRTLAVTTAEKEGTTPEAVIGRWESPSPWAARDAGGVRRTRGLPASERSGYITGAAIQIDGGWYKGVM